MPKEYEFYDGFRDEVRAVQIKELLRSCYNRRHCPALDDCIVIVSQAATIRRLKREVDDSIRKNNNLYCRPDSAAGQDI
jgi:hypothetical protein